MRSLQPLDYYWQETLKILSKKSYPYNIFIALIIIILSLLYTINEDDFKKYIGIYHDVLNFLLIITLFFVFAALFYNLKKVYSTTNKGLNYLIIIFLFVIFFAALIYTYDYFHISKPPEDVLVVAISPFNLIDEYGKTFDDINTRDEFKEKLEEKKDLGIKIIILDSKISNDDDAKNYGEKVGAHLVLYGESKNLRGKREEIKYNIYALPSLKLTPSELETVGLGNEIMEKTSYSTVTDESIVIIEDWE